MDKKQRTEAQQIDQKPRQVQASATQLTLPVHINDDARFENFFCSDANALVVESVKAQLAALIRGKPANDQSDGKISDGKKTSGQTSIDSVFIYGRSGVGCSHLLQAACDYMRQQGASFQYLPLAEFCSWPASQVLEGLEALDLVALDNVDAIAGNHDWEEQLFHLFNRVRAQGGALLMAAQQSPNDMPLLLEDLRSRLNWGLVKRLVPLTDDDKVALLRLRARHRGHLLDDEVLQYIVRRSARDTKSLLTVLERLDIASLRQRRKITIPFIKEVLDW